MRSHVSIITSSTMCISWPPMCLYFWKCPFLHRRLWKWSIPVSNCDLYQLFRQSFCHIWTLFLNVSVKLACSLLTIALMTVRTDNAAVLHGLDISLLQHTWFKSSARHQSWSFESSVGMWGVKRNVSLNFVWNLMFGNEERHFINIL